MDSNYPHGASSSCVLYHSYISDYTTVLTLHDSYICDYTTVLTLHDSYICDYTTVLTLHDSYICDYGLSSSCVENVILFDNNRQCVAASNKQHFATTCRYSPVGMQKMYLFSL